MKETHKVKSSLDVKASMDFKEYDDFKNACIQADLNRALLDKTASEIAATSILAAATDLLELQKQSALELRAQLIASKAVSEAALRELDQSPRSRYRR
ncbi:unnamed protein product [Agarophyton chilense]